MITKLPPVGFKILQISLQIMHHFLSRLCSLCWPLLKVHFPGHAHIKLVLDQSQKTQGFSVADFATLSDERRSRSKIFPLSIWIKEPCVRKFERLERSKRLGISQAMDVGMWSPIGNVGHWLRIIHALRRSAWIIRNRRPTIPSSSPPDLRIFRKRK